MSEERAALKALLVLKSHTNTLILILPRKTGILFEKRDLSDRSSFLCLLLLCFLSFIFDWRKKWSCVAASFVALKANDEDEEEER